MLRPIIASDLVGKTIQSFENKAVNVLALTFTDGTKLELWSEDMRSSLPIPGIYVEDNDPSSGAM